MASGFSRERLEGRSLEHALARQGGHAIRMKNAGTGLWMRVAGPVPRGIRAYMGARCKTLLEAMRAEGLHRSGADCPVRVPGAEGTTETRSVDARLWVVAQQSEALVEVKWTRGGLEAGLATARKLVPMLRTACASGRWLGSRRPVKAKAVGVLVVTPGCWQ
jgi:hypothetical protein